MSKTLGQQVVIENVAGAGGTTGITRAAGGKPDGYTIMMGHMGTHGAAPALYANLKYDPTKDFEPIGMAAGTPILIVGKKNFPANNLQEMVTYLKANADKVNQAHAGIGAVSHMTCILFNSQIGIKPTAVPYSGTGPALNDLVSGQVDYMCDQIVNLVSQIKAGTIKAFAVALPERSPALPDVPTTKEAGMPQYEVSAWNAVFAPKGTPKAATDNLNASMQAALKDPAVVKRFADLGAVIVPADKQTPDGLSRHLKAEIDKWAPIIKKAGQYAD
jgi:tripartite-type tricarboxylate transporter receptor subunit TctC